MDTSKTLPFQLGVFDDVEAAKQAVETLRDNDFSSDSITVITANEKYAAEFNEQLRDEAASASGSRTNSALQNAGLASLGLGAAAVGAGLVTSAGTAVMLIGAASGFAIAGTFAAVMMTRGAEGELADYYDQAVVQGRILVGVETDSSERQRESHRILDEAGSLRTGQIPKSS